MKYNTTNISTIGSRLNRLDSPPLAAGAVCAKACEMNTVDPLCGSGSGAKPGQNGEF